MFWPGMLNIFLPLVAFRVSVRSRLKTTTKAMFLSHVPLLPKCRNRINGSCLETSLYFRMVHNELQDLVFVKLQ